MKQLLTRILALETVAPAAPGASPGIDLELQHQMLLTPPPIWSRTLIWSLSIGSLVLLTWSVFTKIEETSSLPGQLETLRSEVSVRSPDTAVVSAVKVRQYQQVKLNQVLYVLSRQDLEPRLNGLKRKLVMLYDRNYHEQKSLQSRLRQAKAQINLNANIVRRLRSLYQQGSVQEVQLLEKQNQLYQSRQEYQTLSEERAKAAINYRIEANDVRNQLQELQGRSRQFEIHTPIAGTLQKMAVQAKGERVQAGDVLATVVPREGLIAAVQVSSRLAGPIAPGKPVDITVDAFPANDFGTLKGEVETISPTTAAADARAQAQTQPPAYLARIRISPSGIPAEFPAASLRSGMGITARVVLKEKPVISLVFDFVRDLFQPMADRR
jgi:multidrug resistance efflux pump